MKVTFEDAETYVKFEDIAYGTCFLMDVDKNNVRVRLGQETYGILGNSRGDIYNKTQLSSLNLIRVHPISMVVRRGEK